MPQLGRAQTGELKGKPGVVAVKADNDSKVIYRSTGKDGAPMLWSEVVVASGIDTVVCSGITINGYDLASMATVVATPTASVGANSWYIDQDATNNVISIKSSGSLANVSFNVLFMLGKSDSVISKY